MFWCSERSGTPSKNSAHYCWYVAVVPDEARIKCKKEAINKKTKKAENIYKIIIKIRGAALSGISPRTIRLLNYATNLGQL